MTCCAKPVLLAVNTALQSLTANGTVAYATNYIGPSFGIAHAAGTSVVSLVNSGVYSISFNADVNPGATGDITIALYNNGNAIPGVQATYAGTTGTPTHVTFDGLIKVLKSCPCADNIANLQVQVSAAAEITNATITVVKEA